MSSPRAESDWAFPFQRPLLPPPQAWVERLAPAYARHWFSNHGELALELEQRLGARAGRGTVLAANGTAAITAALLVLARRRGVVVLPSFTFAATLGAVLQAGLVPRLADVDAARWELGAAQVEAAAGGEPIAAVLAVRPFGLCRDHAELQAWCAQRGVPLLFDSAAALGGHLADGRAAGVEGDAETFSLHATKVFAVGEGGAIACVAEHHAALRRAMNFGLEAGELLGDGFNGKVSEFTAAVGLAQDDAFDAQLAVRRAAAARYADFAAAEAPEWTAPLDPGDPPWQGYPLLAPDAPDAPALLREAAARGVQLRRYYRPALHTAPAAARHAATPLPVSADLAERMVCLPMYSDLHATEHGALLDRLRDALRAARR